MIFDTLSTPAGPGGGDIIDLVDTTRRKHIPNRTSHEDLLIPILKNGQPVYTPPPLHALRTRALAQLQSLHPGITRTINPHEYPVGLEPTLDALRNNLILSLRK
jgi:nicotinate phosphoribosyltransferase